MESTDTAGSLPAEPNRGSEIGSLLLSLAAISALADLCLWRETPGLSVGLFTVGGAGTILLNRPALRWTPRILTLVALLCCAAIQSAVDLCFSNVLVLIALIFALAGETFYSPLRSGWSRWSEALWSMMKTPARWVWLALELAKLGRPGSTMRPGTLRRIARTVWIILPGVVITLIFATIFCNGNALFAQFTNAWAAAIRVWFLSLAINLWRCFFWAFVAWFALPLLRPSPAPADPRSWTRELSSHPELASPTTSRLQSAVTLALLNLLFCCVNTIDAIYLWARQALPANVSYSQFVHEGVSSLIIAAIFSAILLVWMFQQAPAVSGWTPLRLLGFFWIAQNLILLAGVFLRVKLYVDAFQLTLLRVNLTFFLLLIATGFALLAIHLWRRHSLGQLLHANMLATFFLFYTVQFLDTKAFVASYNVALWERSRETSTLDLAYLESLGPPAFDAIQQVARDPIPESPPAAIDLASDAVSFLKSARAQAQHQLNQTPWESWQLRDRHCQRKLLLTTQP